MYFYEYKFIVFLAISSLPGTAVAQVATAGNIISDIANNGDIALENSVPRNILLQDGTAQVLTIEQTLVATTDIECDGQFETDGTYRYSAHFNAKQMHIGDEDGSVSFASFQPRYASQLSDGSSTSSGKASLGFGVVNEGPELPNVASEAVFEDRQVCIMRKGHPLSSSKMTIESYAAASHALLSISGRGGTKIDDILRYHGTSRRIALRLSHFMTINAVIAATDLIITVPELLANQVVSNELQIVSLPKGLQIPSFEVSLIWHERFTADPAHQWLRNLTKKACKELG